MSREKEKKLNTTKKLKSFWSWSYSK